MQKFIILLMQEADERLYHPPIYITDIDQIAVCDENENLILFDTIEDADLFREELGIDGQIIELPMRL